MAPAMIVKSYEGLEVKARQRLNDEAAFDTFINEFMEKLQDMQASNKDVVVSDLDLSQNKLTVEQWSQVTTALGACNARVLRFRLFGSASLSDDILVIIADYFEGLTAKEAPTEIHLSDCAITAKGFNYFMEKLEGVEYYPLNPINGGRSTPLYMRLENNYIDEQAIKDKIDSGLIRTFTKKENRPGGEKGTKISLLVQYNGKFQQKTGPPPAPEDAPPPKQVMDHNNRREWSSRGGQPWNQAQTGSSYPNRNSSWQQGANQWPATTGAQRWSGGAATQSSRPGASYPNTYGTRSAIPSTQASFGNRPSTNMGNASRGGAAMNHGSIDRSRTPMGNRVSGGIPARGGTTTSKGLAKGGGKGKGKSAEAKLPVPWQEHWSDEYKIPYFWNSESGEAVWERPTA